MRHSVRAALAVAALVVAACDTTRPAAPLATAPRVPHLRADMEAGTFDIPIAATNDTASGQLASTFTGIVIPDHMLHYDVVDGTVSVGANADYTCCFPFSTPLAGTTTGPLGTSDPYLVINVGDDGDQTLIALGGESTDPVQTDTVYDTAVDSIRVQRSGINGSSGCTAGGDLCTCPPGPPGTQNCPGWSAGMYTLSSTEVLHVYTGPIPVMTFTASPDTVSSSSPTITFSLSYSPSSWGSHTFTYVNPSWTFNGTDVTDSCGYAHTCNYSVPGSGTMVMSVEVNGTILRDSVAVVVQ